MTEQGDAQERYEKARAALGDVRLRRVDPRRMGAALLQVLDLHKPDEREPDLCVECFRICDRRHNGHWPCPTAEAVLSALEPS